MYARACCRIHRFERHVQTIEYTRQAMFDESTLNGNLNNGKALHNHEW